MANGARQVEFFNEGLHAAIQLSVDQYIRGGRVIATCKFLENLSLASLVAPVGKDEFVSRYWGQEPLVIHRSNPDYYDDLFTLQEFDEAITRDPSYVKLANAATKKNLSYKTSATGLEGVLADLRDGGTVVLDQLHNREPKLNLLCRALAPEFGHRFQTNLYLTPPKGRGFSPHWDNHDVFILQVVGSKKWQIEKTRRALPRKGEAMGEEGRELRGDLQTFMFNQGDVMYIPRGFVHAAECDTEASLHITLGVTGTYWEDLLYAVVKRKIQQDKALSDLLPFGFMQGTRDDLVIHARDIFAKIAESDFLDAAVDEFRDECVTGYKLDVSGQVVDFLRPSAVLIKDVVGPRRGIVYQIHPGEEGVRVNFGGRSIVFLDIFKDALDFALRTPSFSVGALPGDLADVERIVFIERLIQEGLIIRK